MLLIDHRRAPDAGERARLEHAGDDFSLADQQRGVAVGAFAGRLDIHRARRVLRR
jgi:hypothetical protein